MSMDRTRLTIVIPIYNEREILPHLAMRVRRACATMAFNDYEVLFVSDGSRDGSENMLAELVQRDRMFKALLLTRNFGHQAAVSAGLEHATGSIIAIIDGDLQDPPESIVGLVAALEQGADVAYAVRRKRKENIIKRAAYSAFYRVLRSVASIDIPLDSGDFCCMKRAVVDDMLKLPERNRFVRGIRAWVGYEQVGVEYERHARQAGDPKYTLRKLVALAYDGLFSFSNLPIKLMQFFGFGISTLAMLTAGGYFGWYMIAPGQFPVGWATLVISLWFLGGTQLLFMGILGEYVFRTFDEARKRPGALVRQVLVHDEDATCEVITHKPMRISTADTGGGKAVSASSSIRSAA
jgi:dolichol-phosphate mannosyltransferase